ncbi:hypothetical protein [Saccharopolyspora sp. NPDC002578]
MRFSTRKILFSGIAAGAAVVALGGAAAASGHQAADAPPVAPGHEGEGEYTAGNYWLQVRELTADGEGFGTAVAPGTTYYSKTLHGSDSWKPTVLKFSVGEAPEAPTVFSYPIPAEGLGVSCVASGTEAAPQVRCETTDAR